MIAEEYRALAKATPPGCWKVWAMDPTNEKYYCVGIFPNNIVAHKFSESYAKRTGNYYVRSSMGGGIMNNYAVFQFNGETIVLTERQCDQAIADGLRCRCGDCLDCRVVEYSRDSGRWPDEWYEFVAEFSAAHEYAQRVLDEYQEDLLADSVRIDRCLEERRF